MSTRTDSISGVSRVSSLPRARHKRDVTVVAQGEDYSATIEDQLVIGHGSCTIRLPHADTALGCTVVVCASTVTTGNVTVRVQDDHDPINGTTSVAITTRYITRSFFCDGVEWFVQ